MFIIGLWKRKKIENINLNLNLEVFIFIKIILTLFYLTFNAKITP